MEKKKSKQKTDISTTRHELTKKRSNSTYIKYKTSSSHDKRLNTAINTTLIAEHNVTQNSGHSTHTGDHQARQGTEIDHSGRHSHTGHQEVPVKITLSKIKQSNKNYSNFRGSKLICFLFFKSLFSLLLYILC